ncbi:MAG TPA: DUF4255 domain-containing protein [Vicinamibacterales bacterium]|nr:DUF4255 domain-containing protein [Vicinamibacterales bacterium]
MSGALAIAAVTAVLKDLLNNGVIANDLSVVAGNPVRVTARPPDLLKTGADEEAGLNLFLYHTTQNTTLRNNALPAFDPRGERVMNVPLALDLHYLLTAYGKDEYQGEILMGYAMQLLHDTPVLSRSAIRDSLSAIPSLQVSGTILPPAYQALAAADLADQIELVKISPEPLSVEDLSKLWSAFQANHFRLTAAYTASVVLIQSRKSTRATLPVLASRLYVMPLAHPHIDQVVSTAQPPADVRITAASTIRIEGRGLRGDRTRVQIGAATITPVDPADSAIAIDLATVAGLRAGVQATQVVHHLLLGEPAPGQPHRGFESNASAFVLHPTIAVPATHSLAAPALTVSFTPPVDKRQRVTLYLYEHNAPDTRPARAYSVGAPRDNGIAGAATSAATVPFAVKDVIPGAYLAYVSVDGAESPLALAAGQFDSPRITVTA